MRIMEPFAWRAGAGGSTGRTPPGLLPAPWRAFYPGADGSDQGSRRCGPTGRRHQPPT
jgi:hypothetical protein